MNHEDVAKSAEAKEFDPHAVSFRHPIALSDSG